MSATYADPYFIGREHHDNAYPEDPERWYTLTEDQKRVWCRLALKAAMASAQEQQR